MRGMLGSTFAFSQFLGLLAKSILENIINQSLPPTFVPANEHSRLAAAATHRGVLMLAAPSR